MTPALTIIKTNSKLGTFLKINPNYQASEVENNGKVFVPFDTQLELVSMSTVKASHCKIKLKTPLTADNKVDYFIYFPHWSVITSTPPQILVSAPTVLTPKHSSSTQKQIDLLKKYSKGNKVNLDTKVRYRSQRDNYVMPFRSCNSSSHAMYTDYLLRATNQLGIENDDIYLKQLLKIGDTFQHWPHTQLIKERYGFNTKWDEKITISKVLETLAAGIPVTVNIMHHPADWVNKRCYGGHIIILISYDVTTKTFTTHDPYGDVNTGYKNTNGAYNKMSLAQFNVRSQKGGRFLI